MGIDVNFPIELSPITRRPVLGFIPLGGHPSHVKAANWTLANLFSGGKVMGNVDFWFAVLYFLIVEGKIPYVKESMSPFFAEQMLFRLKNSISSASLTGLSGFAQSKMRLDASIYFSISSSLFLPPPEPSFDTLRCHILHINKLISLAELAKLKIPAVVTKHIHRTQLALQLLNMSKQINGKKILSNIQRCLYQNSITINKNNIHSDLLKKINDDLYRYPEFTLPFVPIDGAANEERVIHVISFLPSLAKMFNAHELYSLIESLLFIYYILYIIYY
jgi:hypothetical protein